MKSIEYNKIESFLKFIDSQSIDEGLKLVRDILGLGLNIETVNMIPVCSVICCGENLAVSGEKLFVKADLFSQLGIIADYPKRSLYDVIDMYTDDKTTILHETNDVDIMYTAYTRQWEQTYRMLYQYVKTGKLMETYDKNELPFLIKNVEDLHYYETLYQQSLMGIEDVKVYTVLKDKNIKHIYLDMDLETGVPYININTKYRMSIDNCNSAEYRRIFLPLSVLHLFMGIIKPLYVEINVDDLIYSNTIGKLSGFDIGSEPDKKICDFLDIDKLYNQNQNVIQYNTPKDEFVLA